MNDPLDSMKTMQRDSTYDTIGDMLTQRPDEAIVLAGRYRIVRKLGEGGMGSVWLAQDTKLDGRLVAIKMLPVVLVANKRAIQQLKAEAKVAIQLAHPNIAILRGFEESDEGPFLVMDYIQGRTLEDTLADCGTLPVDEVIRLFTPIAQALDYAHTQRVVHRDIKPSNILIREDGVPFITDFGIARELKDSMTRVTGRSPSGTLPYMSPEQVRGEAPTPSQDIYSAAATIYECITGHPPFHRGQIEYQVLNEVPAQLPPSIGIGPAIMRALSKNPAHRPRSAGLLTSSSVVEGQGRSGKTQVHAKPAPQQQSAAETVILELAVKNDNESDFARILEQSASCPLATIDSILGMYPQLPERFRKLVGPFLRKVSSRADLSVDIKTSVATAMFDQGFLQQAKTLAEQVLREDTQSATARSILSDIHKQEAAERRRAQQETRRWEAKARREDLRRKTYRLFEWPLRLGFMAGGIGLGILLAKGIHPEAGALGGMAGFIAGGWLQAVLLK